MRNDALAELRGKSVEELEELVRQSREQLLKGRIAQAVENEQQGMTKRTLRRDIARYLTIINEKKAEVQA